MECNETRELLSAYLDREVGVREALEIERHLENCAGCEADRSQQAALRAALRERASYFSAPSHLEHRIKLAVSAAKGRRPTAAKRWNWWNFGAAFASLFAVAWSVGLYLAIPSSDELLADEVVSDHVRSLLTNHTADVASSDQHTVKPWFNGKLDFSPPVTDLTAEGYPLVGGRLDYLDRRPVAALVYRHRQHTINLFVLPAGKDAGEMSAKALSKQGYNLVRWAQGGMVFWAVSDLNATELAQFKDLLGAQGYR